jgi:hypothetical protein
MKPYLTTLKYLGIPALIAAILSIVFPSFRDSVIDESIRGGVFIQAIPFFAAFVCVLLIYIMLIVFAAIRFNGRMPYRTHSAVEIVLIVGILFGVISLFQSVSFVFYRYGFQIVLLSLLGFIFWSHIVPKTAKQGKSMAAFRQSSTIIGAVAGVIAVVVLSALLISAAQPQEPYGERQRVWNTYDDARKAEIAAAAQAEFTSVEVPFLIVVSMLPGAIAFFIVREIAAGASRREEENTVSRPPAPISNTA